MTVEQQLQAARILVVDDERIIAQTLADILSHDGHRVSVAHDGRAALDSLAAGEFDLVLTDVRMPRLDGFGLHRELVERYPHLSRRVVFITGDALTTDQQRVLERAGAPLLRKPFDIGDLCATVRQTLAR